MLRSFLAALAAAVFVLACAPTAERPRVVEQPAAKTVAGRVTRADDGSPVAGAEVRMKLTPPALTDADGRFELRHNLDGYRSVWVVAPGLAMDRQKVDVAGKARVDGVDFRLQRSFRVQGRVVDERGEPVQDARVYTCAWEWPESETRSDVAGQFDLDVPYPPGYAWIIVEADGFRPAVVDDPPAEMGDVIVKRGAVGVLAGRVPPRAHVYLSSDNHHQQSAVADETGRFRFVVVAGSYDVYAIGSDIGEAFVLRDVVINDGDKKTDLVVPREPWLELTGRIGAGLPGATEHAEVAAYPEDFGSRLHYMLSDSNPVQPDGTFALRRLLPGRYEVRLYVPPNVNEPVLTRSVDIPRTSTLVLQDTETEPEDEAIARFDVTGRIESSRPELFAGGSVTAYSFRRTNSGRGRTVAADIDRLGNFVLKGMTPGKWMVALTGPEQSEETPLLNVGVEVTETTRELRLGGRYSGVVRGRLSDFDPNARMQSLQLIQKSRRSGFPETRGASVDAEGRYEFVDVPPGAYSLQLMAFTRDGDQLRASAELSVADSAEPVIADLQVTRIVRIKSGQAAPDFELADIDGKAVTLSGLLGKYVFLDFWATWCAPCRAEIPHLKELASRFADRDDFVLLSISLDDDEERWREYIKKQQMTWRHALDKDGWETGVARRYGVTGIPSTFLIDKDGKVLRTDLRGTKTAVEVAAALKNQ